MSQCGLNHTVIVMQSGRFFDLANPTADDIYMDDVSVHLSRLCRFVGAVWETVAEHCVLVSKCIEQLGGTREEQLAGLLHDAHEAYYGEVTSTLKNTLDAVYGHVGESFRGVYGALTSRFDREIEKKIGLPTRILESDIVKRADRAMLAAERDQLTHGDRSRWQELPPAAPLIVEGFLPSQALLLYRARLKVLSS